MEPGVIKATQNFKRNLLLNLYREREKKNVTLIVCFLLPLKREKKYLTLAAYFFYLGPRDFLPVILSEPNHLSKKRSPNLGSGSSKAEI